MLEVAGGVEGRQMHEGVDGDGGLPEAVDGGRGPGAEERAGAGTGDSQLVVSVPDALLYEFAEGVKGGAGVEGGAEVMEVSTSWIGWMVREGKALMICQGRPARSRWRRW